MATTFSADEARAAIKEHGFFSIQDGELGKRFLEMENKKWSFSFKTVEGFNFCKANVLKDTRVQDTLSAFKRPHILADYTRLAPSRGTIFQLRRGGNDDVLLVHLWGIGSSPIYYRKSQDADLWRILATNNLWQVLGAELKAAGCLGTPINFKDGGLVILDARLAVDFGDTSPVVAAFATPEVLEKRPMDWPLLSIPNSLKPSELAGMNIHAALEEKKSAGEGRAEEASDGESSV